jgi:hypothetical protein
MKFHKLKIAVLEYLHYHQKEDYISIDVLRRAFKKSLAEDIDVACRRLTEEGLAQKHISVIADFESSNSMYRIKITKAGIDFLIDNESSEIGREGNKINRKILYATVASVLIAVLAIVVGLNFDMILPHKIDLINVKITNSTTESITIHSLNDFWLWFPATVGYSYIEGRYEFVADGVIEIPSEESIFLEARVLNPDRFYTYYKNEDCDIQLWLRVNGELFDSNDLQFSKNQLGKYYTEFVVSAD